MCTNYTTRFKAIRQSLNTKKFSHYDITKYTVWED